MGIIERNLVVTGKSDKRIKALFDSGSSYSFIKSSIIDEIGYYQKNNINIKVEIGDGRLINYKESVILQIKLNKNNYFQEFIIGDIPDQMIIGVDFLQTYGHTLKFEKDTVIAKTLHLKNSRGKYRL